MFYDLKSHTVKSEMSDLNLKGKEEVYTGLLGASMSTICYEVAIQTILILDKIHL